MDTRPLTISQDTLNRMERVQPRPRHADQSLTACMIAVGAATLIIISALVLLSVERRHRIETIEQGMEILKQEHLRQLDDMKALRAEIDTKEGVPEL